MIVIASKYLVPRGYTAMAVYPFILLNKESLRLQSTLINHERIHLRQQVELLIIPFFIWYGIEYLIRLATYRNHDRAYRNICFEREAYSNEKKTNYLTSRKFWQFTHYINRSA
jgi:hypothetical protein